jgi:UDP-N-acetylmuramate--alanine ligase
MKYHLIGDQGISMRGIRKILESDGHFVSGSDLKKNGHKAENITSDINFVIRSSAISPGSSGWVEVEAAEKFNIPVIKRSKFIGEYTKDKYLIAVSGAHGKTTVTSLIGLLLIEAGLDPTVLVGEVVPQLNDDVVRIGKSKYFVFEACEYDRSFLDIKPDIAVITNIDEEHIDTYPGGLIEIVKAFGQYLNNIKVNGIAIGCELDQNVVKVLNGARSDIKKILYGGKSGKFSKLDLEIKIIGEHNKLNALAACAVADVLRINHEVTKMVLKEFKGAKRRLEYHGEINGSMVFDDYGHHPTEMLATITALRAKYPDKELITVFWPHQYKRVMALKNEFIEVLSKSDEVILKPIYLVPGRDEKLDISSDDLIQGLKEKRVKAEVFQSDSEIVDYLRKISTQDKIILTIGIPPIYKVAEQLVMADK